MTRRITAREFAERVRQMPPYGVAVLAATVVGLALILTGVSAPAGAIIVGLAGVGILVAIIAAARP